MCRCAQRVRSNKAILTKSELKKVENDFNQVQQLYNTEFGEYIYAVRGNFLIERIHKILELLITKTVDLARVHLGQPKKVKQS